MKEKDYQYEEMLAANPKELAVRLKSILQDHRMAEQVIMLETAEGHSVVAKVVETIREYSAFFLQQSSQLDVVRCDISAIEDALDRLRSGDPELAVEIVMEHEDLMRWASGGAPEQEVETILEEINPENEEDDEQ
jgi:hypothetical protein